MKVRIGGVVRQYDLEKALPVKCPECGKLYDLQWEGLHHGYTYHRESSMKLAKEVCKDLAINFENYWKKFAEDMEAVEVTYEDSDR